MTAATRLAFWVVTVNDEHTKPDVKRKFRG